jgi:hypothetical protein
MLNVTYCVMIKRQISNHLNTNVYQKHGIQRSSILLSNGHLHLLPSPPAELKADWSLHMHVYGVMLMHRDVFTHLPSRPYYPTKNELAQRRL